MRYEISYASRYSYSQPVSGNFNRLRMRPVTEGTQRCEHFDVRIQDGALLHSSEDLFGNHVVEVLLAAPHDRFEVEVDATVVTTEPLSAPSAPWSALQTERYRETAGIYRWQTTPSLPQRVGSMAEELRREDPHATLDAVVSHIHKQLRYDTAATGVSSTLDDLLDAGGGVCQDFAHLGLALLREHGVGARYVSGYFFTTSGATGSDEASAEVDTHAWIEALLPVPGDGDPVWHAVDPTNGIAVSDAHVKIGHGRMYSDVPPVEGTFSGSARSEVDAQVTMRRIEPQRP